MKKIYPCGERSESNRDTETRRRPLLYALCASVVIYLSGCAAVGYKSIPVGKSSPGIDAVIGSIYNLKTETVFKKSDGSEETVESSGIALAIAPDLLLTLDHVVSDYELSYNTPFGVIAIAAEKLRETTYLMGAVQGLQGSRVQGGAPLPVAAIEAIFRDRQADLALFRINCGINSNPSPAPSPGGRGAGVRANLLPMGEGEGCLQPLPVPFGRSSDLRVGDIVYVVGNAFRMGFNVRQGIVSALRAPERIRNANINPENTIMISNGLVPGDSGGPVLAICNGHFELVGLAQGMIAAAPNLGMALKIEAILDKVQEFTGLRVQELDSQPENLGPLNF